MFTGDRIFLALLTLKVGQTQIQQGLTAVGKNTSTYTRKGIFSLRTVEIQKKAGHTGSGQEDVRKNSVQNKRKRSRRKYRDWCINNISAL